MKALMLMVAIFCMASINVIAQDQKEIAKDRKVINKLSESELNSRSSKFARTDTKKYLKEGWLTLPGALPLEKQLDRAYKMKMEFDENQNEKYLWGDASSIGENYDAAKMQALELAKQNLAGKIETNITAIIENSVGNEQLDAGKAASLAKTITASKNLISQNLGQVITVVELYRDVKRNKEVTVQIAYNSEMAMNAAKRVIKQELEKKGEDLHQQLDNAMGITK
jgi:hypothetical protein